MGISYSQYNISRAKLLKENLYIDDDYIYMIDEKKIWKKSLDRVKSTYYDIKTNTIYLVTYSYLNTTKYKFGILRDTFHGLNIVHFKIRGKEVLNLIYVYDSYLLFTGTDTYILNNNRLRKLNLTLGARIEMVTVERFLVTTDKIILSAPRALLSINRKTYKEENLMRLVFVTIFDIFEEIKDTTLLMQVKYVDKIQLYRTNVSLKILEKLNCEPNPKNLPVTLSAIEEYFIPHLIHDVIDIIFVYVNFK